MPSKRIEVFLLSWKAPPASKTVGMNHMWNCGDNHIPNSSAKYFEVCFKTWGSQLNDRSPIQTTNSIAGVLVLLGLHCWCALSSGEDELLYRFCFLGVRSWNDGDTAKFGSSENAIVLVHSICVYGMQQSRKEAKSNNRAGKGKESSMKIPTPL
jgi:hypothetical protein